MSVTNHQESLRNYIEGVLNSNTQDVNFKLYIYKEILNDNISEERQIENSYRLEEKRYVNCVLEDFIGDIAPIQNTNSIEYEIPLTLYVQVDEESDRNSGDTSFEEVYFDKFLLAMEEFRNNLTGNFATIDGWNYAFNLSTLTPTSDINTDEGVDYVTFSLDIYANGSDSILLGNQVTYKLGDESISPVSITPIDRTHSKAFNPNSEQILGKNTATSVIEDNIWKLELSLYYEKKEILSKIITQMEQSNVNQNNKYIVETTIPLYDGTNLVTSHNVILIESSFIPDLGERIVMNLTFIEVDDIL